MDEWVNRWVLGPEDHAAYLRNLGADRLHRLRGRAAVDAWRYDLDKLMPDGLPDKPAGSLETMTTAAATVMREVMEANGLDTILAGIGSANLAAWLAHRELRSEGKAADLVAEVGFVGYDPRPADPFIFNFCNIPTCTARLDVNAALGVLVSGSRARCLGALGAGQVDRQGNINSTDVPGVMRLVGSGGAADVANGARKLVVVVPLSPMRLVEKVPYITAPGDRVSAVVTHRCVLEKDETGDLVLTRLLPHPGLSEQETVDKIRERCGWDLKVAGQLQEMAPPSSEQLNLLRSFDPRKAFLGEPG
jgi:acyl CoA:acetate/3-ketoacid CoA transferase beta subunit